MTDWRTLSPDELDRQYSLGRLIPDLDAELGRYASLSAQARDGHRVLTGLRYGPGDAETLDLFPADSWAGSPTELPAARAAAPLHVFVHGGFWQELSKDQSEFAAPGFLRRGAAFAAIDYGLAPEHDLDAMVAMTRRAVRWLLANAPRFGVDPGRVYLSGHSAGAHLVAMSLWDDPPPPVAGVTLISGVYELEPVTRTWVNDALRLTVSDARRASPLLLPLPDRLPPVVIARGVGETAEFARQQEVMAHRLAAATTVTNLVVAGRNHFDLPYDLPDPDTELGAAVLAQMRLPAGSSAGSSHSSG